LCACLEIPFAFGYGQSQKDEQIFSFGYTKRDRIVETHNVFKYVFLKNSRDKKKTHNKLFAKLTSASYLVLASKACWFRDREFDMC